LKSLKSTMLLSFESVPPKVVHCKRHVYSVYIGRPSPWGNPFTLKEYTREEAIQKYEEWIRTQPQLMALIPELEGQILGCWCHPLPCHGDVLVKLFLEQKENKDGCSKSS